MDHSDLPPAAAPPLGAPPSTAGHARPGDPLPFPGRVTGEGDEVAPPANDDRELARRLQRRDASALAALYHAHRRRAFGLAYRVLGDPAAAEDAVQAAFLALWEQADRIDPDGGSLGALLMTVVHRRSVDLARRRARTRDREASRAPEGHEDQDPALVIPDADAQQAFTRVLDDDDGARRRLSAALARLPEGQRSVVELAYFEGLTHRAIAERLGLPDGTVKSRLRLGLGHLRDALKHREGDA
ncbi:MAG: RNA polymerase sigma factor [Dehalococcoidia bacterium]